MEPEKRPLQITFLVERALVKFHASFSGRIDSLVGLSRCKVGFSLRFGLY